MFLTNNIIVNSISKTFDVLPRHFKKKSVLLMIGILINSVFELLGLAVIIPLLASILKEDIISENPFFNAVYTFLPFPDQGAFILFLCVAVFLFIIVKNGFSLWIQKGQMTYIWNVYESISSNILLSSYKKGFLYFNQENSNTVLNKIVRIPLFFAQGLVLHLFQFLNEAIILLFIVVSLFIYDYKILMALLGIIIPVFFVFYKKAKKRISDYNIRLNEINTMMNKPVFETVFGYVDLSIGGAIDYFHQEYLSFLKESKLLRIKLNLLQQIPNKLIETSVIGAVIIMVIYGHFYLENSEKIITLLGVFGLAAYRSIPSINRLILSLVSIKGQQYNFDIFNEFFPFHNTNGKGESIDFKHKIEIQNLSFKYPDTSSNVLKNVDLVISKGDVIGLVGKSGSGKTTLMNILLGFLKGTSGSILIDNEELNDDNINSWQKKIGYVRQDVFLIDGSLSSNIAFGVPKNDIDLVKLKDAIQKAQLTELVSALPEKENTNIGERGTKLSGGQRQRIGIARALYNDVEVLFFDEATSALDTQTEEEITESIRTLHNENLTMVIIAHRESTLKYCDRVINVGQN